MSVGDEVAAAQRRMDSVMREHTERVELVTRRRDQALAESERAAKEIAAHTDKVVGRLQERRATGWPPERPQRQDVNDEDDFSTQTWLR